MMVGSRMDFEFEASEGRTVGSKMTLRGRVLGMSVDEVVTKHTPPTLKFWETTGTPNLFVIGHCRMGFKITARGKGRNAAGVHRLRASRSYALDRPDLRRRLRTIVHNPHDG